MMKHDHKTKPELWKLIEELEQKQMYLERFLDEKGLFDEATAYVEKCILDREELPFE